MQKSPEFPRIYLASQSPRRQALLDQLGVSHQKINVSIDESVHKDETAEAYVQRLAVEKACAGLATLSDQSIPVLGADTSVVYAGHIFGKPRNTDHAQHMLSQLSGQIHEVMTAVALVNQQQQYVQLSTTTVHFKVLSTDEIQRYIATGEPSDKAGAYAIQGGAGAFITHIEGSYSGVMGLPLYETAQLLHAFSHR